MPKVSRGSIELLKKRWASALPEDAVDTVVRAIDIEGVKVNDILCLGTPNPEFVTGTATAQRDVFDRLANNLLNLVNYAGLNTTVNSPGFGQITSVRPMRSVTLNFRVRF